MAEAMNCPKCGHRQLVGNKECDACGIVFSKHLGFTPIKILINGFVSPKEVMEIRKTQERFSKIQHDNTSKMELIVHCHKEKLLDMAAFHVGKNDTIQNMVLGNLEAEKSFKSNAVLSFFTKPVVIMSCLMLLLLVTMTLLLRLYI